MSLWILDTNHISLIRVGTRDLRIAALAQPAGGIALSVNGIVVTRNHKDFAKVPNLTLED